MKTSSEMHLCDCDLTASDIAIISNKARDIIEKLHEYVKNQKQQKEDESLKTRLRYKH